MTTTSRGWRLDWLFSAGVAAILLIALARAITPDMVNALTSDPKKRSSPSAAHYSGVLANSKIGSAFDSDVATETRRLLPPTFRAHTTRRFIVFSDADPRWALLQAQHLERAAHQFNRVMDRIGLDPQPLRHSLVCVLFDNRDDYIEFAAQHDNVQAKWVSGYYSPKHDRIVFFNVASSPDVNEARDELRSMEEELTLVREQMKQADRSGNRDQAASLRHQLREYEQHLRQEHARLDSYTDEVAVATIVHEAIHQLAYHSGIQRPEVEYPIWVSEGLATVFETEQPNHAFGPSHDYPPRRERFMMHLRSDELVPLEELVQIVSLNELDPQAVSVIYHQSYALMAWITRFRRDELRTYMDLMRSAPPRSATAETHLNRFEAAFGNISRLERAWLRYEQGRAR